MTMTASDRANDAILMTLRDIIQLIRQDKLTLRDIECVLLMIAGEPGEEEDDDA